MKRRMIHTILIKINGIRVKLQDELEEFKNMRDNVSDSQRSKLETRIGSRESMIKELDIIELNIREEL
jgi:hypothetical protein